MEQEARFIAWRDTLTPEERSEADYVTEMHGGNHATAYLAVGQLGIRNRVSALEKRSVVKDATKALGAMAAAAGAFLAGWWGVQK